MSDKDIRQIAPETDVEKDKNITENALASDVNTSDNANGESVENTSAEGVESVESIANVENENDVESVENEQKSNDDNAKNGAKQKKKFKLGTVGKCTLVLVVIAVVAGILLGVVNWLTYVDSDSVIIEKCAAVYGVSDVAKDENLACAYDKNNYVESCFVAKNDAGEVVGYCFYSVGGGAKDGSIELLVYIDEAGVIKEIQVYEQGETAGYFDRVEKANKSKYVGLDVTKLEKLVLISSSQTAQNSGEVAAVSQATYTSTGYHNAIAAAVYAFMQKVYVAPPVEA